MKKIIFLGTGAADTIKYFHSCFYLKENENSLLVDTGGGNEILSQLDKSDIKLQEIKYIFITHKHIDHLLGIFWILRFLGSKISKGEAEKLTIFCSKDIRDIIKQFSYNLLKSKVTDLFETKIIFKVIEDATEININNWKIKCFNIQSTKDEQFGFHLEFEDGTTFVNFGDEPYITESSVTAQNADYILHDAFCLEKDRDIFNPQKIHHSTAKEAALNATKINAKNLILFHSEDTSTYGSRKNLYTEEAKKYFSGNIFVPEDLEVLDLN